MITKTDLLTYLNAPMHLWAAKHNQLEANTLSRYDRYLMTQGVEIEALAKEYLHQKFADVRFQVNTERTVGDGEFLARLDGVVYDRETETYDIYEIKSSTSVSKTHQYDLIFQYLVAAAGLTIKNVFLLHVNKNYDQSGELDMAAFFQIENGNDWIAEIGPEVRALREAALQVVERDMPDGIQDCLKPGSCPCPSLCHPRVPEKYSIYALPRLHKTKARALKDDDILAIDDIPDDFKLSDNQRRHATAVQTGQPQIDLPAIQEKLSELQFPLYSLDYETYNPARPMHPGYKPYQHMVFQYSLHVLHEAGGELEHYDFVVSNDEDPGRQLAAHLAQYIGTSGSVIVWNQGFEAGRNREMAAMYPEYAPMLENINERIYDLMLVFSKHDYVDPDFKGSASIKNVLPVLVKDYAHEYDKLPIPKGDEAMMAWLDLMTGEHTEEGREEIIKNLLAYCELDTMAMVKIWEVLVELVYG